MYESISRWTEFLNIFLGCKAAKYIHSNNEIFSPNEISSKAFTTFDLLSQLPDLSQHNEVKLNDLLGMSEHSRLPSLQVSDRDMPMALNEQQLSDFEKNYFLILERMLPMRALPLQDAIEHFYQNDKVKQMAATYLQRYSDYHITNLNNLVHLLAD